MPLIKAGALTEDSWRFLSDEEALPPAGPVVVSLERWQREQNALVARDAPLGVKLKAGQHPSAIAADVARFNLIALDFPKFTDGRAYSYARLLRERYRYKGELRAVGEVLRDQLLFMHRCGFDAFEVAKGDAVEAWRKALAEFTVTYQPAEDGSEIAAKRRRGKPKESLARMAPAPSIAAPRPEHPGPALLAALARRHDGQDGLELLRPLIEREFRGRIAVVSAFGAESVVLLDLVARVDPAVPVIFLDTGKHFPETLAYRDRVIGQLGLKDVRSVSPSPAALRDEDASGTLWSRDPDRCCDLRKVAPLEEALSGFSAWITGRKRYQGDAREALDTLELVNGRIKVNPLANWTTAEIFMALEARGLPRHPLLERGYHSIGCATCTVAASEERAGSRLGRWQGFAKIECGIHRAGMMPRHVAGMAEPGAA